MQNKGKPPVTVVVVTYNRKHEMLDCLESIIRQSCLPDEIVLVDNNSSESHYEAYKEKISLVADTPVFKFLRSDVNRGVTGGRNLGITNSSGEILVFIDDDAVFAKSDAIEKIINRFEADASLGALAFQSKNYFSGTIDPNEFPYPDKSRNSDEEFETTYFVGVGHAIKKEVFHMTGLYPEDFFYSMEEYDLSYRILNNGYRIIYDPSISLYHKVSNSGRIESKEKKMKKTENKIKMSIRNLPFKSVVSIFILWSGKYLLDTKGDILGLLTIYMNIMKDINKLLSDRNVIKKETIRKIKALGGYLYY